MGCHPSHWRTHIFQDGFCTTNQHWSHVYGWVGGTPMDWKPRWGDFTSKLVMCSTKRMWKTMKNKLRWYPQQPQRFMLGIRESNGRKSCWTWPGSAPKPPGTFSGTFGTFSGTSLNLIRRLQCTPELFWAEDPISLRCRGKMPANTGDVAMKHVKFSGNLSVLYDFAKWYLNRSKLGVSLGTSPRHFCPFQSIKLRVYWGPRSIAKLV